MQALFGRKIENLVDLREATERSRKIGMKGTVYTVDREVEMTDEAFREFGKDFLKDQPWILKTDGGYNDMGEYRLSTSKSQSMQKMVLNFKNR